MTRGRRWLRGAVAVGLATTLALTGFNAPARAETQVLPAPYEQEVAQGLRAGGAVLVDQHSSTLAPGLQVTQFQRRQDRAWVSGQVMTLDLNAPNLSLDVEDGGAVSGTNKTVSEFANKPNVVAAVNGDFFDMNASDAPVHGNVSSQGIRTLTPGSVAFTMTQGKAAIEQLMSNSQLVRASDNTTVPVRGVNSPSAGDGLTVFNSAWGSYRLDQIIGNRPATIIRVRAGVVTSITSDVTTVAPTVSIAPDESVVVARGAAAVTSVAAFAVGDKVSLDVKANITPDLAIGGSVALVTNGELTTENQVTAGRTAVGITADGSKLLIVTIDGRRADADGQTIQELAQMMKDLGAHNAINLDGGGSTTMVGRPAGASAPIELNRPSDGHQRVVSNALVIRSTASTKLAGVHTSVASEPLNSAASQQLTVLPGLSRTVRATGLDEAGRPVTTYGTFAASSSAVAVNGLGETAQVTGKSPGSGQLTYTAAGHSTKLGYRVVGPMQRLVASHTLVPLSGTDATATLSLKGVDGDGNSVPIETSDVQVQTTGPIEVQPSSLDSWSVAGTASGAGTITLTAGGKTTTVAVTVGTVDQPVGDFSDLTKWRFSQARATGTLTSSTGPNGEPALRLQHDFTRQTGTRGSYAVSTTELPVAGQPQALSLWIKGDGTGAWPRIQLRRGDGTSTNIDGPPVEWTGWRQVTFPIPAGTAYPLAIQQIRFMETRSTAKYHGDITVAGLAAKVPAETDLPEIPYVHDPVIIANGSVADRPLKIAVMADGQFVGRNPDSELVTGVRRTLRQIVAAKPDMLIINGDLVDESNDIDFELAKKILSEEVGDKLPYQYVPGNHEIMGQPISNFEKFFGSTSSVHDLKGTRLITLDSATGRLAKPGLDQLRMLEDELAKARKDASITGVLVFNHHPIDDPSPSKASQLSDRTEAKALDRLFAQFRADGKQIAHINGHAGLFHASARDGVSRVINGNSGKAPSSAADQGGWAGWTMLGVDPSKGTVSADPEVVADRIAWLRAETKPWVDQLNLSVEGQTGDTIRLKPGQQLTLTSTFSQGNRQVPVQWPVSHQWKADNVSLTSATPEAGDEPLRFDPATGQLTWLSTGVGSLTLTVNGVAKTVTVVAEHPTAPNPSKLPTGVLGDHTGDGSADVFAVDKAGSLVLLAGDAKGGLSVFGQTQLGWGTQTALVQVNDLTGDGRSDVLARHQDNTLWLYQSLGNGRLQRVRQVGRNWGSMDQLKPIFNSRVGAAQYLIARRSDGALFSYQLSAAGLGSATQIGRGWSGMSHILGVGDQNGDGRADVMAIGEDGTLWTYPSRANGTLMSGIKTGRGWNSFDLVFTPGDFSKDGRYDLVGRRKDGQVFTYLNTGKGWTPAKLALSGANQYRLMG